MDNIKLTSLQQPSPNLTSSEQSRTDALDAQQSFTRTEKRILEAGFAGFIIGAAAAALIFVFL